MPTNWILGDFRVYPALRPGQLRAPLSNGILTVDDVSFHNGGQRAFIGLSVQ